MDGETACFLLRSFGRFYSCFQIHLNHLDPTCDVIEYELCVCYQMYFFKTYNTVYIWYLNTRFLCHFRQICYQKGLRHISVNMWKRDWYINIWLKNVLRWWNKNQLLTQDQLFSFRYKTQTNTVASSPAQKEKILILLLQKSQHISSLNYS